MKIELRQIEKVIPYTRNPRKITPQAISAVAGSIKEFGFKQPIIVDGEGVIIAGHTRLLAAQSLGMEKVPVLVASDLTPAQVQAFRLADNRVAEFSEWDGELLKLELDECDVDLAFADFAGLDFSCDDISIEEEGSSASTSSAKTTIIFPPRVWLTQRSEIMEKIGCIVDEYGGSVEWAE